MTPKKEQYVIELAEAVWLAKALSPPGDRPAMTAAALAFYNGAAVLVTTDRHRIHLLRLGSVAKEFPTRLIDIRRIVFEAQYAEAPYIRIDAKASEVSVGTLTLDGLFAERARVYAPVFDTVDGNFPDFAKTIPTSHWPVSELFAINSEYLADATALASEDHHRTVLYSDGPGKAIAFRSSEDRWLALVMPMLNPEWAADANLEIAEPEAGK